MRRRLKNLAVGILVLGVAVAAAWFSGGITSGLLYLSKHHVLPYRLGKEFTLTAIGHRPDLPAEPDDRVRLTVSRRRIDRMLAHAGHWARAVPPGLLRDGLVVEGVWTPHSHGDPVDVDIPVEVVVGETDGDHPRLSGRLPVSMLNAYMAVEFAEDFVNEHEEYLLGHFDYSFYPTILEATVTTTNDPAMPPDDYAATLGLDVRARGTVKLGFEENLFRTSTDASISDLRLLITVVPREEEGHIILDYNARFTRLKGNVRKLHNIGDRMVSEKLEKKWTRSLNKDKRKRKLARHPLPPWAPLDLAVDLAFYPED